MNGSEVDERCGSIFSVGQTQTWHLFNLRRGFVEDDAELGVFSRLRPIVPEKSVVLEDLKDIREASTKSRDEGVKADR